MHTLERTALGGTLLFEGVLIPWRVVPHDLTALGVAAHHYGDAVPTARAGRS
ncbi:MAG: hypothetical protein M3N46_02605 [Actinomycetota bacterium]|nr:hypothetical protein [Actinomycetota bacterium]